MTIFLTEQEAARLGVGGTKGRRKANHAREQRPDIPRAARAAAGDGDRIPDLMKLAQAGWIRTNCQDGCHWMTHRSGQTTPRVSSYRQMLDEALELT